MRHRSPRPLLDLLRRREPLRPLPAALTVLAVSAVFGGASLLASGGPSAEPSSDAAAAPGSTGEPRPTGEPTREGARPAGPAAEGSRSGARAADRPRQDPAGPTPGTETSAAPRPTLPAGSPTASGGDATRSARADRTAPVTRAWTVSTGAGEWIIAMAADEPASYRCSLDSTGYRPCGPVTAYRDLRPGRHTVLVRATDRAGNTDPTPVTLETSLSPVTNR